jgi:hypothetical protein
MNGKDFEGSGCGVIRILFGIFLKGLRKTMKKHKTLGQDSSHPDRDSNRGPPEYNSWALPLY